MLTHYMITHISTFVLLHYRLGGLTVIIFVHICRWMRNNELMCWEGAPDTDVCFIVRVLYAAFTNSSCFMRNIKRQTLSILLNPMYFWTNGGIQPFSVDSLAWINYIQRNKRSAPDTRASVFRSDRLTSTHSPRPFHANLPILLKRRLSHEYLLDNADVAW